MSKPDLQYTIRNISPQLDKALRKRAKQSGKSFNTTVVESLNTQVFGSPQPPAGNDFDWLFGSIPPDPAFDEAIAEFKKPDPKLWQ